MRACAGWLERYLKGLGFEVELWEGPGHPAVFARHLGAGPKAPTALIYNHYDVQPVDPLELWQTPPFEPTLRDGAVYARGAQDNKGQLFYGLTALGLLLERDGRLPMNVKLCLDGQEEDGSQTLFHLLPNKHKEMAADHLLVVDLGLGSLTSPAVTLGVRGIVQFRVTITGSSGDLHSGTHGGMVVNPNHALVELLAGLRDAAGRVTVTGFYDEVEELTDAERQGLNFRFDARRYEETFGAEPLGGEKDYPPRESATVRPTLEINGLTGGYVGQGFKTVIPAKAWANLSCRLVPHQDPATIARRVKSHLERHAPAGVRVEVQINEGGGPAMRTRPDSPVVKAVARAYEEVTGAPCHYMLEGGSIPIVPDLARASKAEVVMMGWGIGTDNVHAPNEHFHLDRLKKGCATMARSLEILAEKK
jgi:acetylornithine deacetylase/succinyl-diaminopimelate desuccinylase-like protein